MNIRNLMVRIIKVRIQEQTKLLIMICHVIRTISNDLRNDSFELFNNINSYVKSIKQNIKSITRQLIKIQHRNENIFLIPHLLLQ